MNNMELILRSFGYIMILFCIGIMLAVWSNLRRIKEEKEFAKRTKREDQ